MRVNYNSVVPAKEDLCTTTVVPAKGVLCISPVFPAKAGTQGWGRGVASFGSATFPTHLHHQSGVERSYAKVSEGGNPGVGNGRPELAASDSLR